MVEPVAWIGLIGILALIDLCLKELIEEQADEEFPRALKGTGERIVLHKSYNRGFPFGFLKEKPELVKMIPVAAASAVFGALAYLLGKKGHFAEKLAFSLTLGGAVSNLIDRYKRNHVVDYFSFNVRGLKKIIFNLGDLFIFAGMIILMLAEASQFLRDIGKRAGTRR